MKDKFKVNIVNLRVDHCDFIKEHREKYNFNLSKFVRDKLDEYIKFIGGLEIGGVETSIGL